MFEAIAVSTAIGTMTYLWMTVSASPVSQGLRATLRTRVDGWRCALPLAMAVSVIAALVVLALVMLVVMYAPHTGALIGDRALLATGSVAGLIVWCGRAAVFGAPRLSRDVEIALALAVVALKADDARLLSMVEREYARHIVNGGADSHGPHAARTVLGV
jgi:hypothetical protein